jgi:hypothetical protein
MNRDRMGFGGSLTWTILLALVFGVGGYLIGLPGPIATLLAAAVGVAGAALSIGGTVRDDRLPVPQIDLRHGARREIKQLSWNISGQRHRLDEPAVRRLRGIAVARLAALGVDLDDPRHQAQAEALLGRSVYRVLSAPSAQPASVLLRCVAALDRLETSPTADRSQPQAARRAASVPERTA